MSIESMATGELVMFQQMGLGLAVAIFLDATVVRTIIVPAPQTARVPAFRVPPHGGTPAGR